MLQFKRFRELLALAFFNVLKAIAVLDPYRMRIMARHKLHLLQDSSPKLMRGELCAVGAVLSDAGLPRDSA